MDNRGKIKDLKGPIQYRLTNDYMFRAVMQKNVNVLKHLICALLRIAVESVTDIEILNYRKERSLIYLCRLYDNLDSGQNYDETLPAMQISILDFDLFDGVEELCSRYYMTNANPEYGNRYSDDFGITVLNLRQIYNENVIRKEGETELYQWARLFNAKSWEEISMLAEKNEVFDECVYTLAQLSEDEKIRQQCEARLDAIAKENGLYSRGRKEGMRDGEQKGRDETRIDIAKSLLDVLDIPTIAEKTGLTEEEIRKLS